MSGQFRDVPIGTVMNFNTRADSVVSLAPQSICAYHAHMETYPSKLSYDTSAHQRPVNLTLNVDLVQRARLLTGNLSNLVETLLAQFVSEATEEQRRRKHAVRESVAVWNQFSDEHGSIADDYSTL